VLPFFRKPVSSRIKTAFAAPRWEFTSVRSSSRTASGSHSARPRTCWKPSGVVSPLTSANCQLFLRAAGLSKPCR
jgi:hypothetical protein